MKTKTKLGLLLGLVMTLIMLIIGLVCIRTESNIAFADDAAVDAEGSEGFVITPYEENVAATYEFVRLNDTECSVRITNKSEATKAIIPSVGEINGKEYKVTEVANSGFMSSPKLTRVSLPHTIKKIGNNAFTNCSKLNRVNLANVAEIGNSAFMLCPALENLVIPKSVIKVGSYILRNNNTRVRVRAGEVGENWISTWNTNNAIQEVEFNSSYVHPLELEQINNPLSRSTNKTNEYALADGQPRTEEFYVTDHSIFNNDTGIMFIPEKIPQGRITKICDGAFIGANADQIIVEYSSTPLMLEMNAFSWAFVDNITINRDIEYIVEENEGTEKIISQNIFSGQQINSVVLPNTLTAIAPFMFAGCENLENIFFIEPKEITDVSIEEVHEQEIALIKNLKENAKVGYVDLQGTAEHPLNLTVIGDNAFQGTTAIRELLLSDSIETVGALVLADWNTNQYVNVENDGKLLGWDEQWNGKFTNIKYKNVIYTITLNPDTGHFSDDEVSKTIKVFANETIESLPSVINDGYQFDGWFYGNKKYVPPFNFNDNTNIILTAKWVGKEYVVTFEKEGGNGGDDSVKVKFGQQMPQNIKAPKRTGYVFKGYFSEKQGEETDDIVYYTENMTPAYYLSKASDITIFAHWEVIKYKITYKCAGFESWPENIENPNVISEFTVETSKEELTLKNPSRNDEKIYFDGWLWQQKNKFVTSLSGITEDVTLIASWTTATIISLSSPQGYQNITDAEVKLKLKNPSINNILVVYVEKTVEKLTIIGNHGFYNMRIVIENRDTPIVLDLQSISMQAPIGYSTISAGSATLILYTSGEVKIYGNQSQTESLTDAPSGLPAIICSTLSIQSADNLLIKGGDGHYGINGLYFHIDGQNGGNGGSAINVYQGCIINCDNVILLAGFAGNGGNAYGNGYKGYGGRGAYPIETSRIDGMNIYVLIKSDAKNVYLYRTNNGKNGSGNDRPLFVNPENNGNENIIIPPDFSVQIPPKDLEVDPGIWGGNGDILPSFP